MEVVTLIVALTLQAAGREGTVTGTLTLNGTSVPLTHVYASAQPGFFDKKAEDVHVLLSDVPLTDDTRADTFAMIHLARDGKARIVEVVIDASGAPIGGSIYARDFDGMVSVAGMHEFTRDRLERSTIAGRFAMDGPHEFMGVKYQYEARFSAPIPRPPSAEERGAALQSPPARAATAYIAAVRRRDLGGELAADMPADTHVTAVTPQTDGSVLVEVEGHRAADRMVIGHTFRMVLEGGAWKVK